MAADWYTVPPEIGGRTLSLRRRLCIEWYYRRHGEAALIAWAIAKMPAAKSFERLAATFEKLGRECDRGAQSWREVTDEMRRLLPVDD